MFGRQAECFIEYILDVTITEPEGLHHVRRPQSKSSTYPIAFHPLSTPEPIQNYNFTIDQRLFTISTLKLLHEHAGTSLGFRDRARSIFQRESIPKFSFSMAVQAPSIIQLLHPSPIPFLVTVTPDLSANNTTIDTSTALPTLVLRSAKLELKTHIRCRAAGTFADSKTYEIPILSPKTLDQPLKMIHGLTCTSEATLDLGQLCDLRLGNAKLGSKLETPLVPNFTTYNVSRSYHLLWELEIECAEKTEKFSSVKNGPECTVILPPATVAMDIVPDNSMLIGADPEEAMTTDSTGSGFGSGLWSRRSNEGARSDKKEKTGFETPTTVAIGAGVGNQKKGKFKAQEAAEDRALARLHQAEVAYQRRSVNLVSTEPDESDRTPGPTAGSNVPGMVTDTDQQLPRYVP